MKLVLNDFEPKMVGLAPTASAAEIDAAVRQRLDGTAGPPPAATPAIDHDLIAAAVREGKFSAHRADHYAAMYARDPEGTRKLIDKLAPVPLVAASTAGDNSYPAEWLPESRMTPWPRPVPGAQPSRVTME